MTILLAAAWDRWLGEPGARWHPVTLIGRFLDSTGKIVSRQAGPARQFLAGTVGWLLGAIGVTSIAVVADHYLLRRAPRTLRPLLGAALLKPLFAHRLLLDEVASVDRALDRSIDDGRRQVARIVGRDTSQLSVDKVREAALESLAENFSDSLVAPLMWYSVAGIPGAALYRYVNTADAMWGYRGAWEWTGKTAAVIDDVANLVPARVAAALIAGLGSYPALAREARKTTSPNAGWPMAAMARQQGVRLGKPGTYDLNPSGRNVTSGDLAQGISRINMAAATVFAAAALISWVTHRD
jgi:adenosylcobinamide-phosphate synthase